MWRPQNALNYVAYKLIKRLSSSDYHFSCQKPINLSTNMEKTIKGGSVNIMSPLVKQEESGENVNLTQPEQFTCDFCGSSFDQEIHLANHFEFCERIMDCDDKTSVTTALKVEIKTEETEITEGDEVLQDNPIADMYDVRLDPSNFENPLASFTPALDTPDEQFIESQSTEITDEQLDHDSVAEKLYKCEYCDYSSTYHRYLVSHMRSHICDKPHKCTECDYSTWRRSFLTLHMRKHTGEKPFSCDLCDYSCSRKSYLQLHERTNHTKEKPYKCAQCDYASAQASHLKYHIKSKHTREREFQCLVCDYMAIQSSDLLHHMKTHTTEKLFKCDLCDFGVNHRNFLVHHIKTTHPSGNEEPTLKCATCDYTTKRQETLDRHVRGHTAKKPFKCKVCDFASGQSSGLKRHMRTHTKEKPYRCTFCKYSCADQQNLKRHKLTHTGEKRYKCELCDYSAARQGQVKTHVLSRHKDGKRLEPECVLLVPKVEPLDSS